MKDLLTTVVVFNFAALVIAIVMYALLVRRGIEAGRALYLSCLSYIGVAVARLQWVILTREDPSEVGWYIYFTEISVIVVGVLGFVSAIRYLKGDKLLLAMFALTGLLGVLQFGGTPVALLNIYARFYALACLIAPIVVLIQKRDTLVR